MCEPNQFTHKRYVLAIPKSSVQWLFRMNQTSCECLPLQLGTALFSVRFACFYSDRATTTGELLGFAGKLALSFFPKAQHRSAPAWNIKRFSSLNQQPHIKTFWCFVTAEYSTINVTENKKNE